MAIMDAFSGNMRQRGLAAVEFAIVLPLMLMLMLATAELGRAFYQYNTLHKAVQVGARYLASNAKAPGTTGVVAITDATLTTTRNLVVYGSLTGGGTPVLEALTVDDVEAEVLDGGLNVQVQAAYTYNPMFFPSIPTFGLTAQDIPINIPLEPAVEIMRVL